MNNEIKIRYFTDKGKRVHLVLKNRRFLNGKVTRITPDWFVIDDLKEGETPLTYEEVIKVTEFRKKGGEKNDN